MTRSPGFRWPLLIMLGALAAASSPATAQTRARARIAENFRREPNGVVLARIPAGAPLDVLSHEGQWSEVDLKGYVWLRSLQAADDTEFDLVVSAADGENLRVAPRGAIAAHLVEGALLAEVGRDPAWAQVSRRGWIWTGSLDESAGATGGPMVQPEAPGAPAAPSEPASRRPGGFVRLGAAGGPILTAPAGDTLARARGGRDLEVVAREGSWVRVRLEGWVWMPEAEEVATTTDSTPSTLEPDDLTADPKAHIGRVVAWTVQFISIERAEAVRTDFFQGEPFLLTRYGGSDGPFVYVALPAERLGEVQGLVPLERIAITARVRTGASALTNTPIVDLLSFERAREVP